MPLPAAPDGQPSTATAVTALFRQLHDELRGLVAVCDHRALNFVPCPGANSIATIVTHLVGSEAETLRSVAGVECLRDRDAEFRSGEQDADALLAQIDAADALLDELGPALSPERLGASTSLPTLPASERRPGVTWLIGNLGHAREHVGHASLTHQLYEAQAEGTAH